VYGSLATVRSALPPLRPHSAPEIRAGRRKRFAVAKIE
jgi:hypothetical protein